jgi:hypothetical protein
MKLIPTVGKKPGTTMRPCSESGIDAVSTITGTALFNGPLEPRICKPKTRPIYFITDRAMLVFYGGDIWGGQRGAVIPTPRGDSGFHHARLPQFNGARQHQRCF